MVRRGRESLRSGEAREKVESCREEIAVGKFG
jgi:hypothetical protein